MIFICPHCEQQLQVRPQFVGFRGNCKKCGGRIALIGSRSIMTPQWAQKLGPRTQELASPEVPVVPVNPRFKSTLEAALEDISGSEDEMFAEMEDTPLAESPPSPEQLARLKVLGATEGQMSRIATRADAIRLIEVLQPPPTDEQLQTLRAYGVSEEELAFLTTEGVAQAMIDEYETDSDTEDFESDY